MTKEKILPILLLAFLKNICSKKEYDERNAKNDNEMEKNNKENYFSKFAQNQDKSKIRSDNLKNVKDLTLRIHIGDLLINFR